MESLEINGQEYEISGYADDGLPIIKAEVTTTEDGVDADGNPIRSVHVRVPSAPIGIAPGEVS